METKSLIDEKLMFKMVRELCMYCGVAIDMISKKCNVDQTLVAKMFIETFTTIIGKMEEE